MDKGKGVMGSGLVLASSNTYVLKDIQPIKAHGPLHTVKEKLMLELGLPNRFEL